ncbi:4-fold beta flower protein [Pleomorphomonas koreensis]|uniref:4-fold beta flower protein n=1 Tax=Pleomorphomonas koreensis TaxID=257440 RepID=UPI003CCC2E00
MQPLYDSRGSVHGWVDLDTGRIINRHGQHIAFIRGDSIYDWHGHHVAWWHDDHVRDRNGRVALFLRGASGLGPAIPALGAVPARPAIHAVPAMPALSAKPARPARSASWAASIPFA